MVEKEDVDVEKGVGFGENGEDYVRIEMVEKENRISKEERNIKRLFYEKDEKMKNVIKIEGKRQKELKNLRDGKCLKDGI